MIIVRAYTIVYCIFDLDNLWKSIESLGTNVNNTMKIYMFTDLAKIMIGGSPWLLKKTIFSIFPGKVYVDGYLKLYFRYLGVNLKVNSVNNPHNDILQGKMAVEHNFSKSLVIVSILMLIITIISYNSIMQSTVDIDAMSIVENKKKVAVTDYNIGIKYNEK